MAGITGTPVPTGGASGARPQPQQALGGKGGSPQPATQAPTTNLDFTAGFDPYSDPFVSPALRPIDISYGSGGAGAPYIPVITPTPTPTPPTTPSPNQGGDDPIETTVPYGTPKYPGEHVPGYPDVPYTSPLPGGDPGYSPGTRTGEYLDPVTGKVVKGIPGIGIIPAVGNALIGAGKVPVQTTTYGGDNRTWIDKLLGVPPEETSGYGGKFAYADASKIGDGVSATHAGRGEGGIATSIINTGGERDQDNIFVTPVESIDARSAPVNANDPNNITYAGVNYGSDIDAAVAAKKLVDYGGSSDLDAQAKRIKELRDAGKIAPDILNPEGKDFAPASNADRLAAIDRLESSGSITAEKAAELRGNIQQPDGNWANTSFSGIQTDPTTGKYRFGDQVFSNINEAVTARERAAQTTNLGYSKNDKGQFVAADGSVHATASDAYAEAQTDKKNQASAGEAGFGYDAGTNEFIYGDTRGTLSEVKEFKLDETNTRLAQEQGLTYDADSNSFLASDGTKHKSAQAALAKNKEIVERQEAEREAARKRLAEARAGRDPYRDESDDDFRERTQAAAGRIDWSDPADEDLEDLYGGTEDWNFNRGGRIPGMNGTHPYNREGTQFDKVRINATPGEFVLDADSTYAVDQMAPGLLDRVNRWEPNRSRVIRDSRGNALKDKQGNSIEISRNSGQGGK